MTKSRNFTRIVRSTCRRRFTRATAGVLFSRNAVINTWNGRRTLMFRLANARSDMIHEARVHVVLVIDEITAEGEPFRALHDLHLRRSFSPVFGLSLTAMHTIDDGTRFRVILSACSPSRVRGRIMLH